MITYLVLALAAIAVGLVVVLGWSAPRVRGDGRLARLRHEDAVDTVPSVLWPSTWGPDETGAAARGREPLPSSRGK
jgi:hypothetical protein